MRKKQNLLDDLRSAGQKERDRILAMLRDKNAQWMENVRLALRQLPYGYRGTGEDIRLEIVKYTGHPKHHNAWGAAINVLVEEGMLVDTGQSIPMITPSSHARDTRIWRRA